MVVALSLLTIAACNDDEPVDVIPDPVANFSFQVDNATGTVTFQNTSEDATSFSWNFGDGTTSDEIAPTKVYETGTYTVTLTATNDAQVSDTFEDDVTVLIPLQVTLPVNFDDDNTDYTATEFGGASLTVVANPAPGGTNDKEGNVGQITNAGAEFEGFFWDLGEAIDLTEEKSISMNFWSESPIEVLLKLEEGSEAPIETRENHGGTGWEVITFDFNSTANYSRFTLFADPNGTGAANYFVDDIMQAATVDDTPPVITLNGDAEINLMVGDDFVDPGATATDDTDGDISASIVTGGDMVSTAQSGTFVITYDVTDEAGNDAAQVSRTVNVTFDSGLLTNGDFSGGVDPWISGGGGTPDVRTEGGNSFYFANVEMAGDAFAVNLSQVVEIVDGTNYILRFDASSDRERTMLAGIGLNEAPFASATQEVMLTTETQAYELNLAATGFGIPNSRVLFDMGAAVGVVVIDNVSLVVDDSGNDITAPVITLNGDAVVNLTVGDAFTDPGATATDNVDGDISANITVGGDMVDVNTVGTYVITYNVSDAAGNAAAQVTRTVNVTEAGSSSNIVVNGDFSAGVDPWYSGGGGTPEIRTEGGNSFYFANVEQAGDAFAVNLSQILTIEQGSSYKLSFDASSDRSRTMLAGIGQASAPFEAVTETVNLTDQNQPFEFTFTASNFGSADSRVIFDMGADVGVVVIDNVVLELVTSGGGGGGGGGTGTTIFEETFDNAASVDGWNPVASAAGVAETEAARTWNETGGVEGGAMQLFAQNPVDTEGKAYIFQLDASNLNFDGATSVTLTFDAKLETGLNASAFHLQTIFPGVGATNEFDLQAKGLNQDNYFSFSYDFNNIEAGATTFSIHFNFAAGAVIDAGGTALIDNVKLVKKN